MIGRALRAEIDDYAIEMRRSNPLYVRAADGTLTARHIAFYLANVHQLIRYTPIYLKRARDSALSRGDTKLAAHYQSKIGEEIGHDEWAARDLERVSRQASMAVRSQAVPAIRDLVEYLAQIIDTEPALYLSYILFTEQLIVLLGMDWLDLLERRCGIPKSSMTVIANHAELDKDHVEAALEEIDDLVGDPSKLPLMRDALRASISYFNQFCGQVTDEVSDGARVSRHGSKHVSAA